VGASTRDAAGRFYAVTFNVSEALVAFAFKGTLWKNVRFHRHSQTAEFGNRTHLGHFRSPRHGYNEVGGEMSVLGWVVVATSVKQQLDCLDMNVPV